MNNKRRFKVPHTLIIVGIILVIVAISTYIIPGGEYARVVTENGTTAIQVDSFKFIESNPTTFFDLFKAPINGFVAKAEIIAFLFLVGGSIHLISKTNAIHLGIERVVKRLKGKEILIIPILVFLFSLGGAVFGMTEEAVPFILMLLPLMLALGYDSILTLGVTYVSCVIGFASAMLNPFNVGVAQEIAELPLYSGVELRTLIWIAATIILIAYLIIYARRIKRNSRFSSMYEIDLETRKELEVDVVDDEKEFGFKHKIVLLLLAACIGVIVWGVLTQGFWIPEISAVFVITGILSAIIARFSLDETAKYIIEGARDYVGAAVIIGLAQGIVLVAQDAHIIDTVLYYLSSWISNLPTLLAAWLMLPVQMFVNFFVSSGSGQAALTMPIMVPLGDLVGISRQLNVLIFQLGDGFSNAMFPTSAILLGALSVAKIPFSKWFRWIMPLQGILFVFSIIFITIAYLIGW